MIVEALEFEGVKLVHPQVFEDERGFVLENYRRARYRAHGIEDDFVQENWTRSLRGTLRGLHYQVQPGQAKLLTAMSGRIFDVVVDIRPASPTFGKWLGVELDGSRHTQLYLPVGIAHGFCVLSDMADVLYKLSSTYDPATERTIAYDDPDLRVRWPVRAPLLSLRDQQGESFAAFRKRVGP